ncbi:sodium:solute symporter [Dysgonomonas sp. 511]|uniref:sodium:solute symporter n=1 Tax=Dysgonomonas sp. 511 TaxID=2302930 RepID=UPI0013D04861|nr:sodium:solute symporter [Dysgonomonas sp. 511]NDV79708.1 sodium:solute symporter [Dysgonomonas sp. 511]
MRKNKNASDYTSGGGSFPGIVVGMSIFATYVSSISFLALPGNAYSGNWNSYVFSLSIPVASLLAAKYFVPFYRNIQSISAYSFLEERFGYWARAYAAACYLLTQVSRIGSVLFLLALPLHSMLGWSIPFIIIITSLCVTFYSVLGGIKAVIWTDAIQGTILIFGALACVVILFLSFPEGAGQFFEIGAEYDKFSLGSFGAALNVPTFWVMLVYGIFINLQNYGIDQNYVQRYKSAKDDKSARFSALFGGLLYVPVSLLFFIIGTALFVYYKTQPGLLPEGISGDQVFPYFIVNGLPTGVTGLLVAAIFAAGMSTISTSINSGATVILTDFFQRGKKEADVKDEKKNMKILHITSFVLGLSGMCVGLAMISVKSALDAWWSLAGIFSGGMLGLFLLGYVAKKVKNVYALIGTVCGVALISWMTFSGQTIFHSYMTIVLGTITIFCVGFLLSIIVPKFFKKVNNQN